MRGRTTMTLVAVLALVFSMGVVAVAGTTVVDDFEDGDVAGWAGGEGDGTITAVESPDSPTAGNLYVGKVDLDTDCAGQHYSFTEVSPDYFSLYYRLDDPTAHPNGVGFRLSGPGGLMTMVSWHEGSLRYASATAPTGHEPFMEAAEDTWYLIELSNIDWTGYTFDIWVDGAEQITDVPFRNNTASIHMIQAYGCPTAGQPLHGFSVDDIQYGFYEPAEKVKFSESYKLPQDRPLVPDQGWLNIGCDGEFEWPTAPGIYDAGTSYEMVAGKLDAEWKAKYVGTDQDGRWLYQMTQDFNYKKAVFESGPLTLHYQAEDDWYYEWVGSGDYYDAVTITEFDATVNVVNRGEPIWPGNIEPIDGYVNVGFWLYDDDTGGLADWLRIEGQYTEGTFDGIAEGTCGS